MHPRLLFCFPHRDVSPRSPLRRSSPRGSPRDLSGSSSFSPGAPRSGRGPSALFRIPGLCWGLLPAGPGTGDTEGLGDPGLPGLRRGSRRRGALAGVCPPPGVLRVGWLLSPGTCWLGSGKPSPPDGAGAGQRAPMIRRISWGGEVGSGRCKQNLLPAGFFDSLQTWPQVCHSPLPVSPRSQPSAGCSQLGELMKGLGFLRDFFKGSSWARRSISARLGWVRAAASPCRSPRALLGVVAGQDLWEAGLACLLSGSTG